MRLDIVDENAKMEEGRTGWMSVQTGVWMNEWMDRVCLFV